VTQPRQRGSSIQRITLANGDPRWRFRVDLEPGPGGKRRQRTITCKTEAEAVARQAETRGQVARCEYIEPSKYTVAQLLKDWQAEGAHRWRPTTRDSYALAVRVWSDQLGTIPVQKLTRQDVQRVTDRLLRTGGRDGKGRSPRTVALALQLLSEALDLAIDDDVIRTNVARRVKRPAQRRREMSTWTADQLRSFLGHVDGDPLVGLWHLSCRGLRRGEVLGLRWQDVDLTGRTIHVRQTRTESGGKVHVGPPKTERGRRSLPLDDAAVRALRLTYERTVGSTVVPLHHGDGPRRVGDRLVAVDPAGQPLRPEVYGDMFARLTVAAGLPPIRLHDLRHSAITVLLEQGIPVPTVARFAGHDPSVTLRTYAHVTDHAARAAADVFGRAFEGRL